MLRLRRTAHGPPRRGPCWSPCPRLRLAGSTPFGDVVPHCLRQRLPLWVSNGEGFFQKSFSSSPAGAKWSGRGWRFACKSTPEPATAQRAECLLRSTTRGPARSKAICARHAEGVASGHSFSDLGAVMATWVCPTGAQIAFLAIGGTRTSPTTLACAVGQIWGLAGDVCADQSGPWQ